MSLFTFSDKEVGLRLTDEKCFREPYDLYIQGSIYDADYQVQPNLSYKINLCLVQENKIVYKLPVNIISLKWAVASAERVLHIFEEERPLDNDL